MLWRSTFETVAVEQNCGQQFLSGSTLQCGEVWRNSL